MTSRSTWSDVLPLHHRDPFDRLLVSQAIVEAVRIVSVDVALDAYGVSRLWSEYGASGARTRNNADAKKTAEGRPVFALVGGRLSNGCGRGIGAGAAH
jgi:hypothetical protein